MFIWEGNSCVHRACVKLQVASLAAVNAFTHWAAWWSPAEYPSISLSLSSKEVQIFHIKYQFRLTLIFILVSSCHFFNTRVVPHLASGVCWNWLLCLLFVSEVGVSEESFSGLELSILLLQPPEHRDSGMHQPGPVFLLLDYDLHFCDSSCCRPALPQPWKQLCEHACVPAACARARLILVLMSQHAVL